MLMILRFNRSAYFKAGLVLTFGVILAVQFEGMLRLAILFAVASTVFWIATSWWIDDRAHIFELDWLDSALGKSPGKWLNLHVGLDGIAPVLNARFPGETGQTLDISDLSEDPNEATAPSLQHARRLLHQPLIRQTNWRYLPASNQTFDTVFLVLAAHEFRRAEVRERLFIEVQRVLRDDGRIVLVEHLRDISNFVVFGPGAFHFLSRSSWFKATRAAGLVVLNDRRITPFVHAFVFGKQCGSL